MNTIHTSIPARSARRAIRHSPFVVGSIIGAMIATHAGPAGAAQDVPSFAGATAWINSPALPPAALRGSVVLVDFWTYSCINWRRTLPYLRAWNQQYKKHGLVIIGVHTPEFGFERDEARVRRESAMMRVEYPIATDNDYAIWNAFKNSSWPTLYLFDARGRIRHREVGEGNYDRVEGVIRALLAESGHAAVTGPPVAVSGEGVEAAADWSDLKTPETYVGYDRAANIVSPGGIVRDKRRTYGSPTRVRLGDWALSGDWTVRSQYAVSNAPGARIVYRFHARDLHLVMGALTRVSAVRYRVLIDGRAPGAAHGSDVDERGFGVLNEPRIYQLIRQPKPILDRTFEIEFLDAGAEAFSFTFG